MDENRQEIRTREIRSNSIREKTINHCAKFLHQTADHLERIVLQFDASDVDQIQNILKMLELPVEVLQELKVFLEDTLKLQEKLHQIRSQTDSEQ